MIPSAVEPWLQAKRDLRRGPRAFRVPQTLSRENLSRPSPSSVSSRPKESAVEREVSSVAPDQSVTRWPTVSPQSCLRRGPARGPRQSPAESLQGDGGGTGGSGLHAGSLVQTSPSEEKGC